MMYIPMPTAMKPQPPRISVAASWAFAAGVRQPKYRHIAPNPTKGEKIPRRPLFTHGPRWATRQADDSLLMDIVGGLQCPNKVLLFDLEIVCVPEYIAGVLVVPASVKVSGPGQVRWNSRT